MSKQPQKFKRTKPTNSHQKKKSPSNSRSFSEKKSGVRSPRARLDIAKLAESLRHKPSQVVFVQQKEEDKKPVPKTNEIQPPKKQRFFVPLLKEWKVITVSFIVGVLGMGIVYGLFDVFQQLRILSLHEERKNELVSEAALWERIVEAHPDYRDGFFRLALLQYQIGERSKAKVNVDKALQIDPNFEKARELAENLD